MKKIILLLAVLLAHVSYGQNIPKPLKNTYVNDFAKVLSSGQIKALNTKLHRIERLSGVQVAVVIIKKLPSGYDIEDYALLIGRKWHVGKDKNGLVYVASLAEHKQRIEVAKMLTDKFSDERCAEILDGIKPYFKQKDYNGGLGYFVGELSNTLAPVSSKDNSVLNPHNSTAALKGDSDFVEIAGTIIAYFIVFGIPALILFLIIRSVRRRRERAFIQQAMMYNNNYQPGSSPVNGNYPAGYNPGYSSRRSNIGSALGGFAAGAAAGYIAHELQDKYHQGQNSDNDDSSSSNADTNSDSWGDWGSDGSSSNDSSDSGFDGDSGVTSNW